MKISLGLSGGIFNYFQRYSTAPIEVLLYNNQYMHRELIPIHLFQASQKNRSINHELFFASSLNFNKNNYSNNLSQQPIV